MILTENRIIEDTITNNNWSFKNYYNAVHSFSLLEMSKPTKHDAVYQFEEKFRLSNDYGDTMDT